METYPQDVIQREVKEIVSGFKKHFFINETDIDPEEAEVELRIFNPIRELIKQSLLRVQAETLKSALAAIGEDEKELSWDIAEGSRNAVKQEVREAITKLMK